MHSLSGGAVRLELATTVTGRDAAAGFFSGVSGGSGCSSGGRHGATALLRGRSRLVRIRGHRGQFGRLHAEDAGHTLTPLFSSGTQKAGVPYPHQPFGQDVQAPSPQEFLNEPVQKSKNLLLSR
jgi:hypothetical protein